MLIEQLRQRLDPDDLKIALRALRQSPLVWEAIQNDQFLHQILKSDRIELSRWSPAEIAYTYSGIDLSLLRDQHKSPDKSIADESAAILDRLLSPTGSTSGKDQLHSAALASVAILERWRLLDDVDLSFHLSIQDNVIWKTILSILFNFRPTRPQLIEGLLGLPSAHLHHLAVSAASAQPSPIEEIADWFLPVLLDLPQLKRVAVMQSIAENDPAMANILGRELLKELPSFDSEELADPVQLMMDHMERSELLKLSGRFTDALPALDQIKRVSDRLQADLTAQLAQAAARNNDPVTAQQAISRVSALEEKLSDGTDMDIVLAQISTGNLEDSTKQDDLNQESLPNLLASARLKLDQGLFHEGQANALTAFHLLNKNTFERISPEFYQALVKILTEVDLFDEAKTLSEQAQALFPNNFEIILQYAQSLEMTGKIDRAIEQNQIALILSGFNPNVHRALIKALMKQGSHTEAQREAEKLIAGQSAPQASDFLLLGECYLRTSRLDSAIQICLQGLRSSPEDWSLLRLLGVVYRHQNDYQQAQKYFSQSILQNPEHATTWLELADLHLENGEPDKAIEKLLSASNVNPEHPEIYLNIGLHHLRAGNQIKGLTALNQAARFIQSDTDSHIQRDIGFHLGKTLADAGHHEEAIIALEKAHTICPSDGELAHFFSQTLIKDARYQQALPVLLAALDLPDTPLSAHLDYAEILLNLEMNPEEALAHVQKAQDTEPRARILIAQAHAAAGQHCEALELFQEALNSELAQEPAQFAALTIGIAESALKTEQPHIAITFLNEALRKLPDNLDLKQTLCSAYIQMDLKPDALRILADVHYENGDSLPILVWVADQAIALSELNLAVDALNQASELAPNDTEIIVRLGYIQLENGNETLARKTFGQLFQVQQVEASGLRLAAHALLGLGDVSSSIPYIEKALEVSGFESGDLFSELTDLYIQAGQQLAALDTLDKHLMVEPGRADLWQQKSELLEKLGRPKAAIKSLQEALRISPEDPRLHTRIAALYRLDRNLSASIDHIRQSVQHKPIPAGVARTAASIFKASMLDKEALQVLTQTGEKSADPDFLLILAECQLGSSKPELIKLAANNVEQALKADPSDPYALALESITKQHYGDIEQALESLERAADFFSAEYENAERFRKVQTLLAMGEAALRLNLWHKALAFGRQAAVLTPEEPNPSRFIARALTLRAEFKQRLTAVKAVSQSPGPEAADQQARQEFEEMLKSMRHTSPGTESEEEIARWEQRGGYTLLNQAPAKSPVFSDSDDLSAYLAAARQHNLSIELSQVPETWLNQENVKFQLAQTYAATDLEVARQLADDLATSLPKEPVYQAFAAYLSLKAEEPTAALAFIQAALKMWPDEPQWRVLAARLEIERKNFEAGIDHYEQASIHDPDNPELTYNLGCAYMLGGLPGNAIRVLEEAVNMQALEPAYWAKLAEAHQAVEELSEATICVDKAIRLAPENPSYLITAAGIAADDQAPLKSDRLIKKAISMDLRENDDILALTGLLIKRNKIKQALDFLDGLIELSMTPLPLMLQKATLVRNIKGPKEEIGILVSVAKNDPKNPLVLSRLSETYQILGKPAEAIQAGQYALKNGSDSLTSSQLYELHFRLGVMFRHEGQLDQSIDHLTKAIQATPHQVEVYLETAKTLQARREFSKALSYLEKAGEIAPNDPRSFLASGMLMKERKNYQGAENMLRKAAALDPNNPGIKRQLAAVIAMAIIHQD